MNAIPFRASSPRRAALLVHAMSEGDREWVLGALPPHQRVELEILLDELRELGIPPDDALLREVFEAAVAQTVPATPVDRLYRLPADRVPALARVLQKEPPRLVATLLALRDWPWRSELLRSLPAQLAAQFGASSQARAPALQEAVCDAVLRQLDSNPAARAAKPLPKWARLATFRFKGHANDHAAC
jgi:hypothetical protein